MPNNLAGTPRPDDKPAMAARRYLEILDILDPLDGSECTLPPDEIRKLEEEADRLGDIINSLTERKGGSGADPSSGDV